MTAQTTAPARLGPAQTAVTSLKGEAFKALRLKFPPRSVPAAWGATSDSIEQILARLERPPLQDDHGPTQKARRCGARKLLQWMECFPGDTWQQRWHAGPAPELGARWVDAPLAWMADTGRSCPVQYLRSGLLILLCADVFRPDLEWLSTVIHSRHWAPAAAAHRDPDGFAHLAESAGPAVCSSRLGSLARTQIATLLIAKGGGVRDITVGDCLELREIETRTRAQRGCSRALFYSMLRDLESSLRTRRPPCVTSASSLAR